MRAVVIALPVQSGETTAPAEASLAGLSLTLRALLTLQQQGASALTVVTTETQAAQLQAEPRLTVPLAVVPAQQGRVSWSALAEAVTEPFVLVRHSWPMAPAGYRGLLQSQLHEGTVVLRATLDGAFVHALVGGPALLRALADGTLHWETLAEPTTTAPTTATPHIAKPTSTETHATEANANKPNINKPNINKPTAATPRAANSATAIDDLVLPEGSWSADASIEVGRRHAFHQLFEACRKPVDGVISRNLNRHISIWISKRLVNTPITPNAMTGVTFAVGLVAVWLATRGGYDNTLAAAALMQLNSILDGCDGELARVRFQGSKLGQWLDTIGDDVTNVLFWGALGFGALSMPEVAWLPDTGRWLALCAWVTAAGNGLSAAQYYALLWRLGSGDFYAIQQDDQPPPAGFIGALVKLFTIILKQDFFLFLVLLLAMAGVLLWSLPIMAIGALITLASATSRTLKSLANAPTADSR